MFLAGWWVGGFWEGKLGVKSALVVWLTYAIVDLPIVAVAGVTVWMWVLVAVSLVTKLVAVYLGARVAGRRA